MTDIIVNFLHLLATATWLGGALFIHFILQPSLSVIDPSQAGKLFQTIAKRFSITAWSSIVVLIITGFLKTPEGMLFDSTSEMGLTLTFKHVFILGVVIIGLVIGLVVVPRLRASTPGADGKPSPDFLLSQKRLKMLSTTNTVLGMFILVCASMLW